MTDNKDTTLRQEIDMILPNGFADKDFYIDRLEALLTKKVEEAELQVLLNLDNLSSFDIEDRIAELTQKPEA